jgi:hypothetical protein
MVPVATGVSGFSSETYFFQILWRSASQWVEREKSLGSGCSERSQTYFRQRRFAARSQVFRSAKEFGVLTVPFHRTFGLREGFLTDQGGQS